MIGSLFLAESYEEKPDHVTFVFYDSEGSHSFSDGMPVTADDVVFSFNTVMEKGIDSDRAKSFLRACGILQED